MKTTVGHKVTNTNKYDVDGRPPLKEAIPLGLQHIFAMFLGNIAVPIIIAGVVGITGADLTILVQSAMIMAGVATIIQCYPIWKVGAGLPVVMGTSFGFLPTNIAIASSYGISGLLGASLIGGLFGGTLGFFIKKLKRFFPKIVTGTVVLTIGLSLLPTGITSMAGGSGSENFGSAKNWLVALLVLVIVIFLNRYAKGMAKTSSILIGIVVGYIVALPLGMVEFSAIREASWFSIPTPFYFPMEFYWGAILPMLIMFIVTSVETVGDVTAITNGGADREPTSDELSGSVIANGLTSSLAAVFNSLPNTSFSQNVGMIAFTKIMSKYVVAVGAVFLILAGLIPKIGALISTMPPAVIGGATVIIFSQITLTGIDILTSEPLNERAKIIIGLSLVFGLGLSQVPDAMNAFPDIIQLLFGQSGITIACFVAILLNLVIPEDSIEKDAEIE
ncbi:uracil permease [Planococcus kocurii]|uniref:Uracil permease n=1 Tax=Planococcus kocurii TaxID=1374 RepID=A0ABN4JY27_9BACL|nr:nucleobase:cation symporter-2 family protein [Planococcus kocurii]ALS79709.1 uracil permease [Planococcus kocurii]